MNTSEQAAAKLRVGMVDRLVADGAIRSDAWRKAALEVPRHRLIPTIYVDGPGADGVTRYTQADPGESVSLAYQDRTWVTQLDEGATQGEVESIIASATSSSTAPSAVLAMLEDLEVCDGMKVLELGTGTGYSAALLCARLGSPLVTSVERDESLTTLAQTRLADLGYRPYLLSGDGELGCAERGPYDRIFVTFSPDHVPAAWVEQANPNALVLVSLVGSWGIHGYLRLSVAERGVATAHFAEGGPSFMTSRAATPSIRADNLGPLIRAAMASAQSARPVEATVDPSQLDHPSFAWALQLALPGVVPLTTSTPTGHARWLLHADGSWVMIEATDSSPDQRVRSGGPRCLWQMIESTFTAWRAAGSPKQSRYGLTVAGGTNTIWLDDQTNVVTTL